MTYYGTLQFCDGLGVLAKNEAMFCCEVEEGGIFLGCNGVIVGFPEGVFMQVATDISEF